MEAVSLLLMWHYLYFNLFITVCEIYCSPWMTETVFIQVTNIGALETTLNYGNQ